MSEPLVVLENVVKRFGDATAVARMNLEIEKGEALFRSSVQHAEAESGDIEF